MRQKSLSTSRQIFESLNQFFDELILKGEEFVLEKDVVYCVDGFHFNYKGEQSLDQPSYDKMASRYFTGPIIKEGAMHRSECRFQRHPRPRGLFISRPSDAL